MTLTEKAAYRKGWDASGRPPFDLSAAETRFLDRYGEAQHKAWINGWMDRATDRDYGHLIRCTGHYEGDCILDRQVWNEADKYAGDEFS